MTTRKGKAALFLSLLCLQRCQWLVKLSAWNLAFKAAPRLLPVQGWRPQLPLLCISTPKIHISQPSTPQGKPLCRCWLKKNFLRWLRKQSQGVFCIIWALFAVQICLVLDVPAMAKCPPQKTTGIGKALQDCREFGAFSAPFLD